MGERAVFLDRDGVLVRALVRDGKAYAARNLGEMVLMDEATVVVERLAEAGFILVVVTNQPDIARGDLDEKILHEMHTCLLASLGGPEKIRAIYYCPHDTADQCDCRKPCPGMLLKGSSEHGIDLPRSYMIGDRDVDIHAGRTAGCKTVLMDMPYNQGVSADYRAYGLPDAAEWIIQDSKIMMS